MADENYGIRVPTVGFLTGGAGLSNDGIPPHPYETFAYDSALLQAEIENFNVVPYTSVLPLELNIISLADAKAYFRHGGVLEVIMAGIGATYGDDAKAIGTGLGIVAQTKRKTDGGIIGGFAAEYVEVFDHEVTKDEVSQKAKEQLQKSLDHELNIRNLDYVNFYDYYSNFVNLDPQQQHGYCLTCMGFVAFENAPLPSQHKRRKQ